MATVLPLAKLGGLLLKTLLKPLSRFLESQAAEHERIRGVFVCVGFLSHKVTARTSIWAGEFKLRILGMPTRMVRAEGDEGSCLVQNCLHPC